MGILCAVVFYFYFFFGLSGFFGFFFFLSSFLTCFEVNNHSHREREKISLKRPKVKSAHCSLLPAYNLLIQWIFQSRSRESYI